MFEADRTVAHDAMVDPEVAKQIQSLRSHGWGAKRIARELGIARNTTRRYLRLGVAALVQERPEARALSAEERSRAVELFDKVSEGNAVVVHRELVREGAEACVRTVQRVVADRRREKHAGIVATVRYETAPGHQMQIDFGQKQVWVGTALTTVHLLVATLSYSRRVFVKAFLGERTAEWLDGIAAAFHRFGGSVQTLLCDRARCLVAFDRPSNWGGRLHAGAAAVLSRLVSRTAGLRGLPGPHEGQGRERGEVRQAQRAGRPPVRIRCTNPVVPQAATDVRLGWCRARGISA